MRIDAHQHFWRIARGDYGWLTPALAPIYRDFDLPDLAPHLAAAGITGTVLVQAAPTEEETRFLLRLAAESAGVIGGVVGWVDFEAPDVGERLRRLAASPLLCGVRPMIQDIADTDWMLERRLEPAFRAVIDLGLRFDALVQPRHLGNLRRLLDRHPALQVVVDHGAKPAIAKGQREPWAREIRGLARESRAWCKLSGLVTEAGSGWAASDLEPYAGHLLDCFGPARLIWGSDWPVVNLAGGYREWWEATATLLRGLSAQEREAVLGGNAERFYGLQTG
ncbi:MAG TPA: amidohydrolase family protein [Stellaceae bacterium]|nr:amidohydrolase family protein [Stellaceae bacterium]